MCDTANLNSISKCLTSTKRSYGPRVISQYIKNFDRDLNEQPAKA